MLVKNLLDLIYSGDMPFTVAGIENRRGQITGKHLEKTDGEFKKFNTSVFFQMFPGNLAPSILNSSNCKWHIPAVNQIQKVFTDIYARATRRQRD